MSLSFFSSQWLQEKVPQPGAVAKVYSRILSLNVRGRAPGIRAGPVVVVRTESTAPMPGQKLVTFRDFVFVTVPFLTF